MTTDNADASKVGWVPESCTLPTAEQPLRVAEFDELFAASVRTVERVDPTTTRLVLSADGTDRARGLAARESSCCSFFAFEFIEGTAETVVIQVTVPRSQTAVLDAVTARAAAVAGLDR